ncbi:MAG TPA: TetR/AcrR family transcriptional regulator [Povalibacter sp.]|uniref:TetR/AcrR family transcriptional regulator n=1 Tax=Povalibacter sp. TaxID=1962978 RepID=UPI002C27E38B|nr:TetR/AcrR family transcriptional regulator [Povalibacter sp.]HMN46539.1 TetR/AcrR family transcriptional regulator [Povalibacter sp.]
MKARTKKTAGRTARAKVRAATAPRRRGRPPGRPPRNDMAPDTRERILDAAEAQFSAHGFWGVTIREVAEQAKVDTALLHYYFDTKRGLFDAVFARRAEIMNKERIDSIDAYERAAGPAITVEGVINSFLEPMHVRAAQGDPGWHNYFALVAQVNNTPVWGGETMGKTFDRVIHRLLDALRKALPDVDEKDLFWSYHFLSGALTLTLSQTGRIDRLSNGLCKSSDFNAIHARMVPFIAAGFEKLCRSRKRKKEE